MDSDDIIKRIDDKMGAGWTKRLADVVSAPLFKKATVSFEFERFDNEYKQTLDQGNEPGESSE